MHQLVWDFDNGGGLYMCEGRACREICTFVPYCHKPETDLKNKVYLKEKKKVKVSESLVPLCNRCGKLFKWTKNQLKAFFSKATLVN